MAGSFSEWLEGQGRADLADRWRRRGGRPQAVQGQSRQAAPSLEPQRGLCWPQPVAEPKEHSYLWGQGDESEAFWLDDSADEQQDEQESDFFDDEDFEPTFE